MHVSTDVLTVLSRAEMAGSTLKLIGQLDRKLYVDTNKVLEAAGGKWNRKAGAHVFEGDAIEVIEPIILTGTYSRTKQDFGQFDTPPDLAADIVGMAAIEPGMMVLEPSAGLGNLVVPARAAGGRVTCCEIDAKRAAQLRTVANAVNVVDFLAVEPVSSLSFDRVVMNPPFAKQADIDHVLHAAKFLKPGGHLVSIMSAGVQFREDRKATGFRAEVERRGGTIESLPADAFKASGTAVNTCIVSFAA